MSYVLLWFLLAGINVSFLFYNENGPLDSEDKGTIIGLGVGLSPLIMLGVLFYGLFAGYSKAKTFKELTVRDAVFMFLVPTYGLSFLVINPVYIKTRTFIESDYFSNLMDYKPFEHMNTSQIGYDVESAEILAKKLLQLEKENEELKQNSRH